MKTIFLSLTILTVSFSAIARPNMVGIGSGIEFGSVEHLPSHFESQSKRVLATLTLGVVTLRDNLERLPIEKAREVLPEGIGIAFFKDVVENSKYELRNSNQFATSIPISPDVLEALKQIHAERGSFNNLDINKLLSPIYLDVKYMGSSPETRGLNGLIFYAHLIQLGISPTQATMSAIRYSEAVKLLRK